MQSSTDILLIIVIILLAGLIYLTINKRMIDSRDAGNYLKPHVDDLQIAVGQIKTYAQDVRKDYQELNRLLSTPTERGSLGELHLEKLLTDQLPPDMFGIRKRILHGVVPDAHIKSTVGLICIDSKFVLENYRYMLNATDDTERIKFRDAFIKDVQGHLEKIANDYVCPEKGSAEFAFAYIQSESVYHFLETETTSILQLYIAKGVHVVSPLTLSHRVALIKAGSYAQRLSEQAQQVINSITSLGKKFKKLERVWQTLYGTHLKNAWNKAEEIDRAYKELNDEFDKVAKLSGTSDIQES